jgi:hypothetical protein
MGRRRRTLIATQANYNQKFLEGMGAIILSMAHSAHHNLGSEYNYSDARILGSQDW